jgi:hypothetical protein
MIYIIIRLFDFIDMNNSGNRIDTNGRNSFHKIVLGYWIS